MNFLSVIGIIALLASKTHATDEIIIKTDNVAIRADDVGVRGASANKHHEFMALTDLTSIATDATAANEKIKMKSAVAGDLLADGYCWIHEDGKFCFQGSTFQSVSMMGNEILFEEFLDDGKKYSYTMQNKQKLHDDIQSSLSEVGNQKLALALSNLSLLDSPEKVKYDCQVEDVGDFRFNAGNKDRLETNGDGSSSWKLNDWTVAVDSDMIPITISYPRDEDNGSEFLAAIESVEPLTHDLEGCDPNTQGNDNPEVSAEDRDIFLAIMEAHDPSIYEEDYFLGKGRRNLSDFNPSAEASRTKWCGAGTDIKTTPCPDEKKTSLDGLLYDWNADNACRRHDHGEKFVTTSVGIPRLECYVDKDLLNAGGHNLAVRAAYGKYGAMGWLIGCYNYQSYKCWKRSGWRIRYTNCGKKWAIKRGPYRYNDVNKHEGYKERPESCPYDDKLSW